MQISRYLTLLILAAGISHPSVFAQRHPVSIPDLMDQEAASGSPSSVQRYAYDLITLIVPISASKAYMDRVSRRLAQAELETRKGQRKPIPETEVAAAYNELMEQIGAPAFFRTDAAIIHQFRYHDTTVYALPTLLTASENGDGCLPGESTFLLYMLMENDGKLPEQILDDQVTLEGLQRREEEGIGFSAASVKTLPMYRGAQAILVTYAEHHSGRVTRELLNRVFRTLGY
jgi:hypothetical protein